MLVLSRRADETIVFPNLGITVQILRLNGTQARIGVQAPADVRVLRGELAERTPHSSKSSPMRRFTRAIRAHLAEASEVLQRLHSMVESCEWQETEPLVFCLFRELKLIDEQVAALAPEAESPARLSKKQALLVDDNQNEARLLASYLRLKDFEVETADNGAAAMYYLARNDTPDVMLLDMQMPQFDGRWTVNEVRTNPKYEALKIFAVSGMHPQEYGVELGRTGVNQWFRKPLNPEQLVREITNDMEEDLAPVV